MDRIPDELIEQRFLRQRLTDARFNDPVEVVKSLLCVQAQDAPLARYSVGLRLADSNDAVVRAALDEGRLIRTHILRPTWHFVAAEDLRWILALTSEKVEASFGSRHRQLGIDTKTIDRAHSQLATMLAGRRFTTAPDIGEQLAAQGHEMPSAMLRHLLLLAELRGLVCSGPLQGSVHTYGLVDELIPPAPDIDRATAIQQFVYRFFGGHGPASEQDLRRWTTLTLTEIRNALAELGDVLATATCDGTTLWFDPASIGSKPDGQTAAASPPRRAALLPTFDEAYLPYRSVSLPRSDGHPRGEEPHVFAEAGGGVVVVDRHDAGWWKRTVRGKAGMTIRLALATGLDAEQRRLIENEADDLAAFFGREATVELVDR